MGNCCGGESEVDTGNGTKQRAFHGQGHRLGSGGEQRSYQNPQPTVEVPKPITDPNLSQADRDRIRAERAAAAEARIKAQGGQVGKKKPKKDNVPLRGPNSEPLMRWS